MVLRVIKDEDGVGAPVLLLSVQLAEQFVQEEAKHFDVGVALGQRHPCSAFGVDGSDDGYARIDLSASERGGGACLPPPPPPILHGVQPGLVHVDQAQVLVQEVEEYPGGQVSQHQAPGLVGRRVDAGDLLPAHL